MSIDSPARNPRDALIQRRPAPGVVFHSAPVESGQYTSRQYANLARDLGVTLSVGRMGQPRRPTDPFGGREAIRPALAQSSDRWSGAGFWPRRWRSCRLPARSRWCGRRQRSCRGSLASWGCIC
jgi:transposase